MPKEIKHQHGVPLSEMVSFMLYTCYVYCIDGGLEIIIYSDNKYLRFLLYFRFDLFIFPSSMVKLFFCVCVDCVLFYLLFGSHRIAQIVQEHTGQCCGFYG